MKLLFSGCSWTWGDELDETFREKQRWSALASDYFGVKEYNIGSCGASNAKIVRDNFNILKNDRFDILAVQATFLERIELPLFDQIKTCFPNGTNPHAIFGKKIHQTNKYMGTYITYNTRFFDMLQIYCDAVGTKLIVFLTDNISRDDFVSRTMTDIDVVETPLLSILDSKIHMAPRLHPNQSGHKLIAEKIIIPEIEKRI